MVYTFYLYLVKCCVVEHNFAFILFSLGLSLSAKVMNWTEFLFCILRDYSLFGITHLTKIEQLSNRRVRVLCFEFCMSVDSFHMKNCTFQHICIRITNEDAILTRRLDD